MREIPLAAVDVPGPADLATLRSRVEQLVLPRRTRTLLAGASAPQCLSVAEGRGAAAARADITAAIANRLQTLVNLLVQGNTDTSRYQRAVAALVGLGPGLTPTGDDLLVALIATGRMLSRGAESPVPSGAAEALAAAVGALPPGLTTEAGEHVLSESVAGLYPEPLAAFLTALADANSVPPQLAACAGRLAVTGAHSGADWLAGVVVVVERWGGVRGEM